MLHWFIISL